VKVFGSLGAPELVAIFVLALLLFGPKRLPEIGRALGKSLAEIRKATTELKVTLEREMVEEEASQTGPSVTDPAVSGSDPTLPPEGDVERGRSPV
jgi:sec-independent protein translocase protein TatA